MNECGHNTERWPMNCGRIDLHHFQIFLHKLSPWLICALSFPIRQPNGENSEYLESGVQDGMSLRPWMAMGSRTSLLTWNVNLRLFCEWHLFFFKKSHIIFESYESFSLPYAMMRIILTIFLPSYQTICIGLIKTFSSLFIYLLLYFLSSLFHTSNLLPKSICSNIFDMYVFVWVFF